MTSKEALENLYNMACVEAGQKQQFITYAREIEHNENVKKHYDIIKQDLERLEVLENRIKNKIKDFEKEIEIARYNGNDSRAFNLSFEIDLLKKLLEVD